MAEKMICLEAADLSLSCFCTLRSLFLVLGIVTGPFSSILLHIICHYHVPCNPLLMKLIFLREASELLPFDQ